MRFLLTSLDGGITYAPDGTEFENMQILDFIEADNVIEARRKFLEENPNVLTHGYEDKYNLRFYVIEDALFPEEDTNFFDFSLCKNEIIFWGTSIGNLKFPLDEETKEILKENNFVEGETVEFSEEIVQKLYRKFVLQVLNERM